MLPLPLSITRPPSFWLLTGLVLLSLLLLLVLSAPYVLWAYNLQQAGQYLEQGVEWPEPRLSDALPVIEENEALEETLGHLAGAIRWYPQHAHAHRLAGQIYAAREEWLNAAEAYTQAREWAPDNPLLAWESGLIYEQMLRIIENGPSKSLLPELACGQVEAPDASFESPYCRDVLASCYIGETSFTLPLADLPDGQSITVPTLFLHAPAKVRYPLTLPTGNPALAFMLGLDPTANEWGSDGATFQLWVELPNGPVTMVYERSVDAIRLFIAFRTPSLISLLKQGSRAKVTILPHMD